MGHEAIKLELIEWLMHLDDSDTINYLKIMKDSSADHTDWWESLDDVQKQGINRGLEDVDSGRFISHEEMRIKYEL